MLFYSLLTGYFVLINFIPDAYSTVKSALTSGTFHLQDLKFLAITLILLFFCIILTKFTAFHIVLLSKNSTTIESLENNYNYAYSISAYKNFTQVFGKNPWTWFFPYYGKSGKPGGDGILWPMIDKHFSDSDVNIDSETNREHAVKAINGLAKQEVSIDRQSVSPLGKAKSPSDIDTDSSFIRLNSRTPNRFS